MNVPEGLLVSLGYAITRPGHSLEFHEAKSAAARSGFSGVHQWSVMLPTSARVAQEVYGPLIGIQYPVTRMANGTLAPPRLGDFFPALKLYYI